MRDSEINFLEMEKTKKSGNLGNVQQDREKRHLPPLPSKEWETLISFHSLTSTQPACGKGHLC